MEVKKDNEKVSNNQYQTLNQDLVATYLKFGSVANCQWKYENLVSASAVDSVVDAKEPASV